MVEWHDLLSRDQSSSDEYGPSSQAVISAFDALGNTEWLSHVGQPLPVDVNVVVMHSWDEALSVFDLPSNTYDVHGHLLQPALRCITVMRSEPYKTWWMKAVGDAGDYYDYLSSIPSSLGVMHEWVNNYLYQYISYLLSEIIGTDVVGTTYFRELLPWFYAGHFPCGWEGDWPQGRLRVY